MVVPVLRSIPELADELALRQVNIVCSPIGTYEANKVKCVANYIQCRSLWTLSYTELHRLLFPPTTTTKCHICADGQAMRIIGKIEKVSSGQWC